MNHLVSQPHHQTRDLAVQGMPVDVDSFRSAPDGGTQQAAGLSPLQVALRRKWLVLGFALTVAVVTGLAVRQLTPRYSAAASVVVDARQLRVSGGESLLPSQAMDFDLLRTRIEAARDPRLAEEVVQQLNLTNNPDYCLPHVGLSTRALNGALGLVPAGTIPASWLPAPADAAPCPATVAKTTERLVPTIGINNDGRSYVIRISADASSPELAASIANAYAKAFVKHQHEAGVGLTDQTATWLTSHLAELRTALIAADTAVQRSRDGSQLTLQRGETVVAQRLAELNTQLTAATGELQQKRSILRTMEAGSVDAGNLARSSPIVQRLIDREGQLAASLADLQTRLGPDHPQVRAASAQLAQVRGQIRLETSKATAGLRGEVDSLDARRTSLAAEVDNLQRQVAGQGPVSMRVQDLQRDADSARKQYDAATARLEQIQADAATQRSDVQLMVPAFPPQVPSFPRSNMITAGTFLAAIGLGAALAFVLELMSRVFSTPEQIETQTDLRVLGLFAKPNSRKIKPEDMVVSKPTSRESEAVHAILINLLGRGFNMGGPTGRVVMVTSAVPGEGKTSFSVALGRVARRSGLSVAIVDCDLRRSQLSRMFDLKRKGSGLQDVVPADEPLQIATDTASGLSLVTLQTAGPAHPHAVLGRELRAALDTLRGTYDLVILDTPPVLALPDALSMGGLADDTVMLNAWRSTRRSECLAALKMLRRARVSLAGIVMTKVDLGSMAKRPSQGHGFYATAYPAYHGT